MTRRSRGAQTNSRFAKTWTIVCVCVIMIAAIVFRGYAIYELYPLDYEDEVVYASDEFGLDPYFVCAVIASESGYDPAAVSHRGAVGLMQIMPDTGAWIANHMGMEGYTQDMLFDPAINIRLGCWYLRYLSDRFDGDQDLMIAAYNAGPARVAEWLESGVTLEELPYQETDNYVKRVGLSYHIYKGIYDEF